MSTKFRITLGEFSDLEVAVGLLDTNGTEEFELGRFSDGELGLKVWRDGEPSAMCRLGDWAQDGKTAWDKEVAAQRER